MGRWFGRSKQKEVKLEESKPVKIEEVKPTSGLDYYDEIGITVDLPDDERELVSVISSAIMAGSMSDSKWKVNKIVKIDEEKEVVVAIAAAIAAQDYPNSTFRLKKITKV